MPLTLIATPGAVDANAYADAAAADAVAEYRVGAAAWADLTADQKVQALVTATRDIDSIEGVSPGFVGGFVGDRASDTQALEWPRTGTAYYSGALPKPLVDATIELALSYVPMFATGATGDVLNADPTSGNVKREKTGPLETEYFEKTDDSLTTLARFPAIVQRLLLSLVRASPANLWGGSAAVARGS